ncbi:MAG: peroxiredoxin [Gammaproteobacteria bacterium CG11_big_fil_rev_8_21_14_0_20_46_22]|nr:MAG: peroxiredoxin [Gammaproteobacteria bacterium CG12_big_fil_rev_8_21_14_0_65_46_12]PIR10760.1 MAG: peroxiredoxin [Gammaproteobacteria bacterium CG11_big_fil_rev_8_21_14_0_20_46_22]
MMISVGKKAPNFTAKATNDKILSLKDFKGRYLVIYFYPKDNTPGCTQEGQDFRDLYAEFQALDADIVGVSKDSLRTHSNFKAKYALPFDLVTDEDESLCQAFDVIKLKKLYGKEYLGIERSSFLIGPDGTLLAEWRKVKVKDHAKVVLDTLKAL